MTNFRHLPGVVEGGRGELGGAVRFNRCKRNYSVMFLSMYELASDVNVINSY